MAELVLLHHNEPMTTSLAIAEGTENTHESVIKLVRKYVEDLQELGTFGFEIQKSGGRPTEVAYLNEPQSTLLITYMRNTEIVRRFKISLVKAFYELRDRLAPVNRSPRAVDHRADILVSADRTFRAILRSSRAAGARLPAALARANEVTVRETGVDMLAEIGPVERPVASLADPVASGIADWEKQAGPGPWTMAEILHQAFGVTPEARDYGRLTVQAGPALRSVGIERRRVRRESTLLRLWERSL